MSGIWPTPHGHTPPKEWTEKFPEGFGRGSAPHVGADGRFAAWVCEWGREHLNPAIQKRWKPGPSLTGNRVFHRGEITTLEGETIAVGTVPYRGGHSSAAATDVVQAVADYDKTELQRVVGRAVETEFGMAILGSVLPGTTVDEVAGMRRSGMSGDWRWFNTINALDFVSPVFVTVPGLPIDIENEPTVSDDTTFWDIVNNYDITTNNEGTVIMATGSLTPTPTVDQIDSAISELTTQRNAVLAAGELEAEGGAAEVVTRETAAQIETLTKLVAENAEAIVRLEARLADADELDVPDIDDADVSA